MRQASTVFLITLIVTMTTGTSSAWVSISSGLTYENHTRPGDTYNGVIQIVNSRDQIQTLKLYQTDYRFFSDGRNLYDEPGTTDRSNAGWITFSPKRLTIPPNAVGEVPYTVRVPDDSTLVGTYWSMIMVEPIVEDSPEDPRRAADDSAIRVRQVIRYGLQMISHVGEHGEGQIEFHAPKLLKDERGRFLQVDVKNVGQLSLTPTLWTELYDQEGSYVGKYDGGRLRTFPGTSARFKIDLSTLAHGTYKAMVVGDCGGDDIFGARYTLKLEP